MAKITIKQLDKRLLAVIKPETTVAERPKSNVLARLLASARARK